MNTQMSRSTDIQVDNTQDDGTQVDHLTQLPTELLRRIAEEEAYAENTNIITYDVRGARQQEVFTSNLMQACKTTHAACTTMLREAKLHRLRIRSDRIEETKESWTKNLPLREVCRLQVIIDLKHVSGQEWQQICRYRETASSNNRGASGASQDPARLPILFEKILSIFEIFPRLIDLDIAYLVLNGPPQPSDARNALLFGLGR